MTPLAHERCADCTPETPALTAEEVDELRAELRPEWTVLDGRALHRDFRFRDFKSAFARASEIADIAEEQGHHPDLHISWGRLGVDLTTHAVHGLTRNDFILAAKIDALQP